jgi:hypothetical protein
VVAGVFLGELLVNGQLLLEAAHPPSGASWAVRRKHGRGNRRRVAAAPSDRPARRARQCVAGERHAARGRHGDDDQRDDRNDLMYAGGAIEHSQIPTFWRTWLLGDTAGRLIVLP